MSREQLTPGQIRAEQSAAIQMYITNHISDTTVTGVHKRAKSGRGGFVSHKKKTHTQHIKASCRSSRVSFLPGRHFSSHTPGSFVTVYVHPNSVSCLRPTVSQFVLFPLFSLWHTVLTRERDTEREIERERETERERDSLSE